MVTYSLLCLSLWVHVSNILPHGKVLSLELFIVLNNMIPFTCKFVVIGQNLVFLFSFNFEIILICYKLKTKWYVKLAILLCPWFNRFNSTILWFSGIKKTYMYSVHVHLFTTGSILRFVNFEHHLWRVLQFWHNSSVHIEFAKFKINIVLL